MENFYVTGKLCARKTGSSKKVQNHTRKNFGIVIFFIIRIGKNIGTRQK